jgi:hypothetical protein
MYPRLSHATTSVSPKQVGVYKVRGPSERTKEEEENGQHYGEGKVSVVHDCMGGEGGGGSSGGSGTEEGSGSMERVTTTGGGGGLQHRTRGSRRGVWARLVL